MNSRFCWIAVVVAIAGCHRRAAEAPKACHTAVECERVYQQALAAHRACRDNTYGSGCEDQEREVNASYEQAERARALEAQSGPPEPLVESAQHKAYRLQWEKDQAEREQLKRDLERQHAEEKAELERKDAEEAAAEAAKRTAIERRQGDAQAQARRHGFSQIAFLEDGGLAAFLEAAIEDAVALVELQKTVVELSPRDEYFQAVMTPPGDAALFVYDNNGPHIFLKAPPTKTVYQSTSLTALGVEAVRVTGVRSFQSADGVHAQAFVLEAVWGPDVPVQAKKVMNAPESPRRREYRALMTETERLIRRGFDMQDLRQRDDVTSGQQCRELMESSSREVASLQAKINRFEGPSLLGAVAVRLMMCVTCHPTSAVDHCSRARAELNEIRKRISSAH